MAGRSDGYCRQKAEERKDTSNVEERHGLCGWGAERKGSSRRVH